MKVLFIHTDKDNKEQTITNDFDPCFEPEEIIEIGQVYSESLGGKLLYAVLLECDITSQPVILYSGQETTITLTS